jgi:hypothetical protein
MLTLVLKAIATAAAIVVLSEIGKRWPAFAGLLLALPLATALTMVLLHVDGVGGTHIAKLAWSVLLLMPPGFVFLGAMVVGLNAGAGFWITLTGAVLLTLVAFVAYSYVLGRFGLSVA